MVLPTRPRPATDPPSEASVAAAARPTVEERIRIRRGSGVKLGPLLASALGSFCLLWLVYERLTPLSGGLGFAICWYAAFVLMYWLTVRDAESPLSARDKLATVVVSSAGVLLVVVLAFVVGYTVWKGFEALRPQFFTTTMESTGPDQPATAGGGIHAIVGSAEQVGISMLVSVPLGFATALFLNEIGGRLARPVRLVVDAMSAIPSILAGLFIYAVLILGLGQTFSGFAGALALSILMLPTVTRTAEVVLRLVPGGLREGALALGGTEWRMARLVILPTARAGLVTAIILGVARCVGETAPLLLTVGTNTRLNANPFSGQQAALPTFIYQEIRSQSNSSVARGWTTSVVLLVLILALFILARRLGGRVVGRSPRGLRTLLRRKASTS